MSKNSASILIVLVTSRYALATIPSSMANMLYYSSMWFRIRDADHGLNFIRCCQKWRSSQSSVMDLQILGKPSVLHVELNLSIELGDVLILFVCWWCFLLSWIWMHCHTVTCKSGSSFTTLMMRREMCKCWCPYCIWTSDTEVWHQLNTYSTYQLRTSLAFLTYKQHLYTQIFLPVP